MRLRYKLPLTSAIWLIGLPLNGWAISSLWNWFIAPPTGWREINGPSGFGIYLFVLLLYKYSDSHGLTSQIAAARAPGAGDGLIELVVTRSIGLPVLATLSGAFIHSLI